MYLTALGFPLPETFYAMDAQLYSKFSNCRNETMNNKVIDYLLMDAWIGVMYSDI